MSVPAPTTGQRQRQPRVSDEQRRLFLEALSQAYSVRHAAAVSGAAWRTLYKRRASDPVFAEEWQQAFERGTDVLRDEIRRRAVDGWDEPVYQRGELVGYVRKFDANLLMFEARRRDPSYRDNRLEVTGANGGPVELAAGYQAPTLADVVELAGRLGVLEQLGYQRADVVEGEAVEVAELTEGEGEGEA